MKETGKEGREAEEGRSTSQNFRKKEGKVKNKKAKSNRTKYEIIK